jgi:hypothetical protein
MRITNVGSDFIRIDEDNIVDEELLKIPRVHIIKLDFFKPTESKVKKVINLYPKTMRFVIENNIKTYNYILRGTNKKYYVENSPGVDVISFFKKNNKVLCNFNNFDDTERQFLLTRVVFESVLKNTEVIIVSQSAFETHETTLNNWSGNVIISNSSLI